MTKDHLDQDQALSEPDTRPVDLCSACGMEVEFARTNRACGRPDSEPCIIISGDSLVSSELQSFFEANEVTQDHWFAKAEDFLAKYKWQCSDKNRDEMMLVTVVYLCHMESIAKRSTPYPFYVVHSQDNEWRLEAQDYKIALAQWKQALLRGEEVGMFHWKNKNECERVVASNGYSFTRDYGRIVP